MSERRLEWKKVFKDILGDNCQLHRDNVLSEECDSNICCKETKENPKLSSLCSLKETCDNRLSKSDVNYCYTPYKKTQKFSDKGQSPNHHVTFNKSSVSDSNKNEVPEWNNVFKSILGKKSVQDSHEQKDSLYCLKKPEPSQKQNVPIKKKGHYKKRKPPNSVLKPKRDEEEEKVREMFALSRVFKVECSINNVDLDGAGVNTFKCHKELALVSCDKITGSKLELSDNCDEYSELTVPVTGLIANIKPLTRDVILNSPYIPLTEAWDDDLLF